MRQLEHPCKADMEAVLALIRGADPGIAEGIKWNAPSFRTVEYFATLNVRDRDAVQIILHLGAKVRPDITRRVAIDDPNGLLQWLANDRANVKFRGANEIETGGPAFQSVVRQWIAYLK
jgi:hypothetical protein